MGDQKYTVIYGAAIGNFDVENILKYIEQNGISSCTLYLEKEPVENVAAPLKEKGNIEIRIVKKPGKEAKLKEKELKSQNRMVERLRLEKVSDRSSFRGGC